MKIVEKAHQDYKTLTETGNLHGFTPFEVNSIWFILKDVSHGDTSGTLSEKLAKWFTKRGFSVKNSGVGWSISLCREKN